MGDVIVKHVVSCVAVAYHIVENALNAYVSMKSESKENVFKDFVEVQGKMWKPHIAVCVIADLYVQNTGPLAGVS